MHDLRDQHLPAIRDIADAAGQGDRRTEQVAAAIDSSPAAMPIRTSNAGPSFIAFRSSKPSSIAVAHASAWATSSKEAMIPSRCASPHAHARPPGHAG